MPPLEKFPQKHKKQFEELNFEAIRQEVSQLKKILEVTDSPIVFSHNDCQSGNIIFDNGKIHFIDMEYAGFNHRGFDIANHFCEFAGLSLEFEHFPSKEVQKQFIQDYLISFLQSKSAPF